MIVSGGIAHVKLSIYSHKEEPFSSFNRFLLSAVYEAPA
jgi:hypothetical protein